MQGMRAIPVSVQHVYVVLKMSEELNCEYCDCNNYFLQTYTVVRYCHWLFQLRCNQLKIQLICINTFQGQVGTSGCWLPHGKSRTFPSSFVLAYLGL